MQVPLGYTLVPTGVTADAPLMHCMGTSHLQVVQESIDHDSSHSEKTFDCMPTPCEVGPGYANLAVGCCIFAVASSTAPQLCTLCARLCTLLMHPMTAALQAMRGISRIATRPCAARLTTLSSPRTSLTGTRRSGRPSAPETENRALKVTLAPLCSRAVFPLAHTPNPHPHHRGKLHSHPLPLCQAPAAMVAVVQQITAAMMLLCTRLVAVGADAQAGSLHSLCLHTLQKLCAVSRCQRHASVALFGACRTTRIFRGHLWLHLFPRARPRLISQQQRTSDCRVFWQQIPSAMKVDTSRSTPSQLMQLCLAQDGGYIFTRVCILSSSFLVCACCRTALTQRLLLFIRFVC